MGGSGRGRGFPVNRGSDGLFSIDPEGSGELAEVDGASLLVGEHGAEAVEDDGRCDDALLREVAFDVAGDEVLPPLPRSFGIFCQVALGVAAALPVKREVFAGLW